MLSSKFHGRTLTWENNGFSHLASQNIHAPLHGHPHASPKDSDSSVARGCLERNICSWKLSKLWRHTWGLSFNSAPCDLHTFLKNHFECFPPMKRCPLRRAISKGKACLPSTIFQFFQGTCFYFFGEYCFHILIGSMWLAYLPTFTIKINHSCR